MGRRGGSKRVADEPGLWLWFAVTMRFFRASANQTAYFCALLLSAALAPAACSSDDAVKSSPESGAGAPAMEAGGAPAGGSLDVDRTGGPAGEGGGPAGAGATGAVVAGGASGGAASEGGANEGGATGAGGAPNEGAECLVTFSMNTSDAVDAGTPLDQSCEAIRFDGQMNFEIYAGDGADQRNLNIDFFDEPVMGKSVNVEDGYDFEAGRGAAASYIDSAGVWNADRGSITLQKVDGDLFRVKLTDLHFVVLGGGPSEPTNSGEFVASGTITATAMPGN